MFDQDRLVKVLREALGNEVIFDYYGFLCLTFRSYGLASITESSFRLTDIPLSHSFLPRKTYEGWDETLPEIIGELRSRIVAIREESAIKKVILREAREALAKLKADFPLADIDEVTPGTVTLMLNLKEAREALTAVREKFRSV